MGHIQSDMAIKTALHGKNGKKMVTTGHFVALKTDKSFWGRQEGQIKRSQINKGTKQV